MIRKVFLAVLCFTFLLTSLGTSVAAAPKGGPAHVEHKPAIHEKKVPLKQKAIAPPVLPAKGGHIGPVGPNGGPLNKQKPAIHEKKDPPKHIITPTPTLTVKEECMVYLAGSYAGATQTKPCYWAGETRVELPIPEDYIGSAGSITVYDGTIYTTGEYHNKFYEYTFCYWIGTTRVDLPSDIQVGKIYFYNGQKYMTGSFYDEENCLWLPCYWIGNERVDLPVPAGYTGGISSIDFQGDVVYACGNYSVNSYGDDYPCYWEGTNRIDLPIPDKNWGHANSIFIRNGKVYTAGGYKNSPMVLAPVSSCYWEGKKRIDLSKEGGEASQIFFYNDELFIVGTSGWYWKGGSKVELSLPPWKSKEDGNSECYKTDMCFYNGNIYTAGYGYFSGQFIGTCLYTVACYWDGSNRKDLPDYGMAKSIYVGMPIQNVNPTPLITPTPSLSVTKSPTPAAATPTSSPSTVSSVVYTMGEYLDDDGWLYPCYWKGTDKIELPKGARSIYVYKGKVYTVGSGPDNPCYWDGSSMVNLPVEGSGNACDIFVEEGKVYTAGSSGGKPCYWEGTTRFDLPLDELEYLHEAQHIFVDQGTVYTYIGIQGSSPFYWKGNTRVDLPLPEGYTGTLTSLYVYKGKVYASGSCCSKDGSVNTLCYWEGSNRVDLPLTPVAMSSGAGLFCIYADEGIVYTAGRGPKGLCYWEGTTRVDLPTAHNSYGCVRDICVIDGKVYTTGFYENVDGCFPCYWVDTIRTDLPGHASAYSIFVEKGF